MELCRSINFQTFWYTVKYSIWHLQLLHTLAYNPMRVGKARYVPRFTVHFLAHKHYKTEWEQVVSLMVKAPAPHLRLWVWLPASAPATADLGKWSLTAPGTGSLAIHMRDTDYTPGLTSTLGPVGTWEINHQMETDVLFLLKTII